MDMNRSTNKKRRYFMDMNRRIAPNIMRSISDRELCRWHLPGLRICHEKEGERRQFAVDGVKYDMDMLWTFSLAACYLGYLKVEATGENPVRIPVHLIEELRPQLVSQQARAGHVKTLARAAQIMDNEEKLARRRTTNSKRQAAGKGLEKIRTLTFDIKDVRLDVFEGRLLHTLEYVF